MTVFRSFGKHMMRILHLKKKHQNTTRGTFPRFMVSCGFDTLGRSKNHVSKYVCFDISQNIYIKYHNLKLGVIIILHMISILEDEVPKCYILFNACGVFQICFVYQNTLLYITYTQKTTKIQTHFFHIFCILHTFILTRFCVFFIYGIMSICKQIMQGKLTC